MVGGLRVRLTTAFNRILQRPGPSVRAVAFTDQGIVIGLGRRRLLCPCGATTMARYDSSRRRWRHLDFGVCQVWLEADIHHIDCRACGRVRTEQVPWGRPNARHTSDFENVVAWLAQRCRRLGPTLLGGAVGPRPGSRRRRGRLAGVSRGPG
jgi:transposase